MSKAAGNAGSWQRVEELFHDAVDLPASEREAFLARECEADEELRRQVEELLSADLGSEAVVEEGVNAEVVVVEEEGIEENNSNNSNNVNNIPVQILRQMLLWNLKLSAAIEDSSNNNVLPPPHPHRPHNSSSNNIIIILTNSNTIGIGAIDTSEKTVAAPTTAATLIIFDLIIINITTQIAGKIILVEDTFSILQEVEATWPTEAAEAEEEAEVDQADRNINRNPRCRPDSNA